MRPTLTQEESIPLTIHMPALAAPSRPTAAIIDLVERSLAPDFSQTVTAGLPAGAKLLSQQQLAIAGTVCTVPLFRDAMEKAARKENVDVILARHDSYPELFSCVLWDAAVRVSGDVLMLPDLILYVEGMDDYWLVPSKVGPSLRISRDGLHLFAEAPFVTWNQRCTGVCEAARRIVKATRPGLEG
jgi:hypothetical protein